MKRTWQFGLAALFGGLVFQTATAQALYRRTPGADCNPIFNTAVYGIVEIGSNGGRADLGCPLAEDDRLPKNSVHQVHVHGHNNGGTVFAEVCDLHWFDNGLSCTGFFTSTATEYGIFIDNANLSGTFSAANAGDTAGVYVILPSGSSNVRQIYQGT